MNLLGSLMGLVSIQAVHGWLSTYERLVNSHPYGILCQPRQGHPQPNSGKSVSMADEAVKHILENRPYTGCAVNFKSTTVSFKVHKKIYNPVEEQQIIPNMQEPIISEELFDRVEEIRQNPQQFKFAA